MSSFYLGTNTSVPSQRAKQTETEMEKLREMEKPKLDGPKWQESQTQLAHLASNL